MFKFIAKIKILKQILVLVFLQFFVILVFSQNILLVEKPGKVNNIKYRVGDRIDLKMLSGERHSGIINQIRDTAIVVNYILIMNNEIKNIYTLRRIISAFSHAGIKGGIGYFAIDGFNSLINNERPVFRNSTLKTAGIMFGVGLFFKSISKRKRHIDNENWRIKVLNFSILKDPGIYNKEQPKNANVPEQK